MACHPKYPGLPPGSNPLVPDFAPNYTPLAKVSHTPQSATRVRGWCFQEPPEVFLLCPWFLPPFVPSVNIPPSNPQKTLLPSLSFFLFYPSLLSLASPILTIIISPDERPSVLTFPRYHQELRKKPVIRQSRTRRKRAFGSISLHLPRSPLSRVFRRRERLPRNHDPLEVGLYSGLERSSCSFPRALRAPPSRSSNSFVIQSAPAATPYVYSYHMWIFSGKFQSRAEISTTPR